MMSKETARVALVTGAARGIGAGAAVHLARAGMDVAVAVRSEPSAAEVVSAVRAQGRRAAVIACDVSSIADAANAVDRTVATLGRLDVLVNNAGVINPIGRIAEADDADWERNIQVNLVGPFNMVRAALPVMVAAGGGTIVNLSSGAAHRALEGWSAYCAAKAGLAMFTQSIALEYGIRGIRVFGFAPGTTDTEMQSIIRSSGINPISRLQRSDLVPVDEPAAAIVYLCSPQADDLVGKELTLNDSELRRRVGIRLLQSA